MMKQLQRHHDILLHLLDELPDGEAFALQEELVSLFGTLRVTHNLYEAVAGKIRVKASVHKVTDLLNNQI